MARQTREDKNLQLNITMAEEFNTLYESIIKSAVFEKWIAQNPKAKLSHFFAQINQNYIQTTSWDLGFFNEEDQKITVFTKNDANEVIKKDTDDVFKKQDQKVTALDPKLLTNLLDFKDTVVHSQKAIQDSFPELDTLKGNGFAILQILQDETVKEESLIPTWNISFITKKLSFLNIKLEATSGKLISAKEHSMLDTTKQ